jgi:putative sterol carrier protein
MTTRTIRQTMEGMPLVFDPEEAEDLEAVIQFDLSGEEPGAFYIEITGGQCSFNVGVQSDPALIISAPSEVWGSISRGEISGSDALLDGLYRVRGDAGLLMRMDRLFGRPEEAVRAPADWRRPGPLALRGSRWLTVVFLPWVVLWLAPLFGIEAAAGVRAAFAFAAAITAYHLAFGRPTWFEVGSTVLLGPASAWSLAPGGGAGLSAWGGVADSLALGVIWLSSLIAVRPLTAEYSQWDHAPALRDNGTFLHVNRVLTFVWGAVFVAMGVLSAASLRWPGAANVLGPMRWSLLIPAIAATAVLPRRASRLRIENVDGWRRRLRLAAGVGIVLAIGSGIAAASIAGSPAVAALS